MSEDKERQGSYNGIQYLGGLEPEGYKRIQQAVEEFKIRTGFKKENDIVVHELPITGKTGTENKPLAHRYKVTIYLGDEKVNWPVKHGDYLTENGVINFLTNLTALWNFLKNHRVKKNIEKNKRIGQLNRAAAASEKTLASW